MTHLHNDEYLKNKTNECSHAQKPGNDIIVLLLFSGTEKKTHKHTTKRGVDRNE